MKRGKKYIEAAKLIERGNLYDKDEAVALVKKAAVAKFDETIEAHIRTGCDGRHADQQIRGAVVLPHGTGKKVRTDPEDPERRMAGFRRCSCNTGYDGRCRTSRTCARTEGPYAEPESRNSYNGRNKGDQRH